MCETDRSHMHSQVLYVWWHHMAGFDVVGGICRKHGCLDNAIHLTLQLQSPIWCSALQREKKWQCVRCVLLQWAVQPWQFKSLPWWRRYLVRLVIALCTLLTLGPANSLDWLPFVWGVVLAVLCAGVCQLMHRGCQRGRAGQDWRRRCYL